MEHREGGYFSETFRSPESAPSDREGGERNILTSIYYLLTDDRPIGHFHLNQSDIIHYYQGGSPLSYYTITTDGELRHDILGPRVQDGQVMQLLVKGGVWKATHLESGEYGLLGEAVAPGFDYRDMTLGKRSTLLDLFPQHREIIERLSYEE